MRFTLKYLLAYVLAFVLVSGSLSLLQGCSPFDVAGAIYYVATTDQREVTVAMSQYGDSVVLGDREKEAAFFDENAELTVEGQQAIVGRASILDHLKSVGANKMLANDFTQTAIYPESVGYVQTGTYRQIVVTAEGATTTEEGKFEAEWVKRPARGWSMRRLHTSPTVIAN
jgi:hypothetical protein